MKGTEKQSSIKHTFYLNKGNLSMSIHVKTKNKHEAFTTIIYIHTGSIS